MLEDDDVCVYHDEDDDDDDDDDDCDSGHILNLHDSTWCMGAC